MLTECPEHGISILTPSASDAVTEKGGFKSVGMGPDDGLVDADRGFDTANEQVLDAVLL